MRAWGLLVALVGCYNPTIAHGVPCGPSGECPNGQSCIGGFCDPGASDAATDVPVFDAPDIDSPDAPALCTTWTAKHFAPCALPAPLGPLALIKNDATYTWDTDTA